MDRIYNTIYTKKSYILSVHIIKIFPIILTHTICSYKIHNVFVLGAIKYTLTILLNELFSDQYTILKKDKLDKIIIAISESYVLWPLIIMYSAYPNIFTTLLMLLPNIYFIAKEELNKNMVYVYSETDLLTNLFKTNNENINFKSVFGRHFLKQLGNFMDIDEFICEQKETIFDSFFKQLDNRGYHKCDIIYNVPDILMDEFIKLLEEHYSIIKYK
jgi:hypothetical protein